MNTIRKNQWLTSNAICMAKSNAVACNLMFTSKKDHTLFLHLWDKYLGAMTQVINYHLAPTGWTILFKTKSDFEIKRAYHYQRKKSKKAKNSLLINDVGKILSEHFRILISQYVRKRNRKLERKGTLVISRFQKCILNNESDYEAVFHKIIRYDRKNPQPLKKYQADETKYDIKKEITRDSIWKSGNKVIWGIIGVRKVLRCMFDYDTKKYVLRKLTQKTQNHNPLLPFT